MEKCIGLYLISGFLGSGKTTFLQRLLTQQQGIKTGVIVNEFGDIGIDGMLVERSGIKMVEINHGSIFCSCLKGGFVKTLIAFSKEDIDILVIENSGMADPSNIHRLLGELEGRTGRPYEYRGAVCIVDAVTFLRQVAVLNPVRSQVAASSLLVINKTDLVNQDTLQAIREKLRELNPGAYLFETVYSMVPPEILRQHLSDNGCDAETSNRDNGEFVSFAMECRRPVEVEKLNDFVLCMGKKVLRLKGIVDTKEGWYQIDGVEGQVSIKPFLLRRRDSIHHTRVVVIQRGCGIKGEELLAVWKECTGEEGELYE